MTNGDKIFKFLQKCNRYHNTPDMGSFIAKAKNSTVFVECRGSEVYIEQNIYDEDTDTCKRVKWVGSIVAAANRLEQLEMDYDTISF